MEDCRPMTTPMITNWKKIDTFEDDESDPMLYRQLIGSLMYLVNTRPGICYVVNTLSQFMVEPKRTHWAAAKHVLRYLQGTIEFGLKYTWSNDVKLSGFTDVDWAGSSVDRKSTHGYCFSLGLGMTSWCSRKQKSVALSSAEAENMAASTTSCEAIWLQKLLVNLLKERMEATRILCDNQSCIKLPENVVFHDRSKHIDMKCHFIRDCVQRGAVQLQYTPTGEQVADILTKAIGKTFYLLQRENGDDEESLLVAGMDRISIQRKLWYRCNSDSGSVKGSSTEDNSAVNERQQQRVLQKKSKYCWNTFLAKREC